MTPERCEYDLTFTLVSPFLFESVVNTRVGVDCAQIRDEVGRPMIPATQVKGVLRDAMETLAGCKNVISTGEINRLFGTTSVRGGEDSNEPQRGLAIFADLVADGKGEQGLATTRIKIGDETGAVEPGALQVIELAARFGQKVAFTGTIIIRYSQDLDRSRCEAALRKAVRLIPAIGAMKSAGFGAADQDGCSLELKSASQLVLSSASAVRTGERFVCRVTFDRPLLVDARYVTDNLYESAKILPGAVFKGALADRLALAGEKPDEEGTAISSALSALRISHAFPVADGVECELPTPESIVYRDTRNRSDECEFGDAIELRCGQAPMWDGDVAAFVAGAKKKVRQKWMAMAKTPRWDVDLLPRTHIAMNEIGEAGKMRRMGPEERVYTSAENLLYASVAAPAKSHESGTPHEWQLAIDPGAVADKILADRLIAALKEGLDDVGKTGAHAYFREIKDVVAPELPRGEIVDFMLKTPAVMFDAAINQNASLEARYRNYFAEELPGIALVNLFARQAMAGGYQAMRRRPYDGYYPFVLTEPGAVFRVKITNADGRTLLANALRFGLPVPKLGGRKASWRNCPFVPENGYGEIVLHRPTGLCEGVLKFVDEVGAEHVR